MKFISKEALGSEATSEHPQYMVELIASTFGMNIRNFKGLFETMDRTSGFRNARLGSP